MSQKEKKKTGRPRIDINLDQLKSLCAMQCTQAEILSFFKVDDQTLQRRLDENGLGSFKEFFHTHRQAGFTSVRRTLWELGVNRKNPQMAMFLAKNWLHMADKVEQQVNLTGNIQTSSIDMGDVKKIHSDPIAKKLSLELAERLLELEEKESTDENQQKDPQG